MRTLPSKPQTSALTLLAMLTLQTAQAAPVCDSYINVPLEGTSVINSSVNTCLSSADYGGTLINIPNATLTNTGVIRAGYSSKLENLGAFTNYSGAELHLQYVNNYSSGTFTNMGFFRTSSSSRLNNDGLITNNAGAAFTAWGYIKNSAGASLVNAGTFTNEAELTNAGSVQNNSGAQWNNSGVIHINAGANLTNNGVFNHSSSIYLNGSLANNHGASLDIEFGGITIQSGGQLVNNGEISITRGDINILAGSSLTGSGTIKHGLNPWGNTMYVHGSLVQNELSVYGGIDRYNGNHLYGSGSITAAVTMYGGKLSAGTPVVANPMGNLDINGDLSFQGGALLTNIRGTAAGTFDTVTVTGDIDLTSATFEFDFFRFTPSIGDSWIFLIGDTAGLTLEGINLVFNYADGFEFALNVLDDGLQLTTVSYAPPVPLPASAWLLGSGIAALVAAARRKAKPAA